MTLWRKAEASSPTKVFVINGEFGLNFKSNGKLAEEVPNKSGQR